MKDSNRRKKNLVFLKSSLSASGVVLAGLMGLCCALLTWQAFTNAPTSDEMAQLACGIASVQTGDPAYYRVNPPLHRVISGLPVEWVFAPKLEGLYNASEMPSGRRLEFRLGHTMLECHPNHYRQFLLVGRLVRIPFILGAGWFLAFGVGRSLRPAFAIAAALWFTSPLVLGHGWAIMPDAFSGSAMIFLMITTLAWLKLPSKTNWLIVGLAWGVALGTKFTFGPVFVVWPLGLGLHAFAIGKANLRHILRLFLCHIGHGFVALAVVISIYGGAEVGVPLSEHNFQSQRFRQISGTQGDELNWLGMCPSPLPKQFLVGVDEQQRHVEIGVPNYFLGARYEDGMYWYYMIGLLAKEQLVFVLGTPFLILGCSRFKDGGTGLPESHERFACWLLCCFGAMFVLALFSFHSRLAFLRYLFPALPLLFIMFGLGVQRILDFRLFRTRKWLKSMLLVGLVSISILEIATTSPYFFSYTNPLFGGSYRVPAVLHDSNFDGAQDLWRLEQWLAKNPVIGGKQRYICVHGGVPANCLSFQPQPPTNEILEKVVAHYRLGQSPERGQQQPTVEIVVLRGLGQPTPWITLQHSNSPITHELLIELLHFEPSEHITPTVAIYRY